ncbi:MAG: ABC transporter ATP-binding protein [Solobacterium sp.]|nr:ABC transporter ATP-binding protein [Solobacterium sp.]
MSEIRIEDLELYKGNHKVLDVPELRIADAGITMIVGPSGAGKTTLLRFIAGLEKPDRGRVFFGDRDVTDAAPGKRKTAVVFQDGALFPDVRLYDNIAYGLRALGLSREEIDRRTKEKAGLLHIEHLLDRLPSSVSAGERQRAGIARALVREPELILMDEPFSNLDRSLREELREETVSLQKRYGMTMLFVTHDQQEAFGTGDDIMVMKEGKIIGKQRAEEMWNCPDHVFSGIFFQRIQVFGRDSAFGRRLLGGRDGSAGLIAERIITGSGDLQGTVIRMPGFSEPPYMETAVDDAVVRIPVCAGCEPGDRIVFDISGAVILYDAEGRLCRDMVQ